MANANDLQIWFDAVQLYDNGDIDISIEMFQSAKQTAKMLFNIGCCYLKKDDLDNAEAHYLKALELDSHMAIAYFMLGLIYYLAEEFDYSFDRFVQAHEKLRGNRYVDYQQLGFKYKLYSCEILTNQAVVAYRQKKIRKAKTLLLEAVGCKAERKHENIEESLSLLQSGYPINPFIPPQSEIFRPPKAAVKNLKRKDYLGTAQVISTQNNDEIYACFSGVKNRRDDFKKPSETRKKLMTDLKDIERKSSLRPTPRPPKMLPKSPIQQNDVDFTPKRPPPRSTSRTDDTSSTPNIPQKSPRPPSSLPRNFNSSNVQADEEPQRKASLPPPKSLPTMQNDRKFNLPPPKILPSMPTNPVPPARSGLPRLPSITDEQPNEKQPSPRPGQRRSMSIEDPPPTYSRSNKSKPPPPPPQEDSPPAKPPHKKPPGVLPPWQQGEFQAPQRSLPREPDENYNDLIMDGDDGGELYEDIDSSDYKYRPPRPPPILPKRNSESKEEESSPLNNINQSPPRQRRGSNAQKPARKPPPPPANADLPPSPTLDPPGVVSAPPRKFFPKSPESSMQEKDLKKELSAVLKRQSATLPPGFVDIQLPKKTVQPSAKVTSPTMNGGNSLEYDVEIQYTFVKKIKIPDGLTLNEVTELVKSQSVPDDIELW
eukprot:TCONS_00018427-protein